MKKAKWGNFFGTVLAGATVFTVMKVSKKLTKKYGQSAQTHKLINKDLKGMVNYGVNAFMNMDDETIDKIIGMIS